MKVHRVLATRWHRIGLRIAKRFSLCVSLAYSKPHLRLVVNENVKQELLSEPGFPGLKICEWQCVFVAQTFSLRYSRYA